MQQQKQDKKQEKYDSSLTDGQWKIIEPLIPPPQEGGRPRTLDMREVVNAVFSVSKSGGQWRMLPNDFPKWQSVYNYFSAWKKDGTGKKIHDTVRGKVRAKAGEKRTTQSRHRCFAISKDHETQGYLRL